MTELSVHAPEILWEDGDLLLYRAVPDGEALPVLAAMPSTAPRHAKLSRGCNMLISCGTSSTPPGRHGR
jgi:hypothetical protein